MKIGYYEENNYHTEILATFIEPFIYDIKNNKIEFTVYNSMDKSQWVDYYKKIYNFNLKQNEDILNDIDSLDKIIIGTSINTNKFLDQLDDSTKDKIKNKIFYICHLKEDLSKNDLTKTIVLSPLNLNNFNAYILPINNSYDLTFNKKKLIIGLIGRFKDDNRDLNDLIDLIKKNSNYNFCIYIFSRHEKFIPKQLFDIQKEHPSCLKIFLKKNTEYMIKFFKEIKFICPLSNKDSIYYQDRLTGLIPISYNFNIPCIIEKELGRIYNIQNCIKYDKSLSEVFSQIYDISNEEYNSLVNNLKLEKESIIKKNNNILKEFLFR